MNNVTLYGNLGNDPELKPVGENNFVTNFSLATSKRWTNPQGEMKEVTQWHKIVCWGKSAESCAKYLKKGSRALIEGELQTRKWQNSEGVDQYTTEIVARHVHFGAKQSGESRQQEPVAQAAPVTPDEIPF